MGGGDFYIFLKINVLYCFPQSNVITGILKIEFGIMLLSVITDTYLLEKDR